MDIRRTKKIDAKLYTVNLALDNSYAIIILSVGLIILLVIAIAGWLDKCKTFCQSVLKEQKVAEEKAESDSTIPHTQSTTDSEETSHPERNV